MKLVPSAFLLALVVLCARQPASAEPELKSWLGSAFTVPGEETELWISVLSDKRPDAPPEAPRAADLAIRFLDDPVYPAGTRERLYLYKYSIRSYAEGSHTIPPFALTLKGQTLRSQPVKLNVAPLLETAWSTHPVEGAEIRYASSIFTPRRAPYEGETFPTEAKVYLPVHIKVTESSIAELDHDGMVAWRFEASKEPYNHHVFLTSVRFDGLDYHGVSYRSTATPIRTGPVSLGPGHARIKLDIQTVNRGLILRSNIATRIPVTRHEFQARPLPPNPPAGFKKAVGRFALTASADTSGLEEGDPISLLLSVSGIGNLDTLDAPDMVGSAADWKVYPPGRLERRGERRDVSGVVTFSQIIRPLGAQREIPPFRLVVFDPEAERYTTVTTPPIPFDVQAARINSSAPLAVLPDVSTPVEEMEGILGIIDPTPDPAASSSRWWRYWHALPAALALILIFPIARRHLFPRLRPPSRQREVLQALHSVEQAGSGAREFLRAAGRFIESWIPDHKRDEELNAILERRDHDCFRQDAHEHSLATEDRGRIIRQLRERALATLPVLLMLATLLPAPGARAETRAGAADSEALYRQASAAWEEGSYHAAMDLYRSAHPDGILPADVQYNIGNCYFQLGERGRAAWHYHRALHQNPHHAEARQNLRFLKRKTGAITLVRPDHQEWLGKTRRSVFSTLLGIGLWATALSGLGLFAALTKSLRILVWIGLSAGPLAAIVGGVSLHYYPSDAHFAPVNEQAIVISAKDTLARTEAHIGADEVIAVPPGSICRPLATRGPWTYVELADRTRGWLLSETIHLIVSDLAPDASPALDLGA